MGRKLTKRSSARRGVALGLIACVFQLIPFSCGQEILRLVTPILLDDTVNFLDALVETVAPLVLP